MTTSSRSLWNVDIVPTIAARYGLADTRNGPKTGPHDWGWEVITADDETRFLYEMSNDPVVSPLLMDAMANSAPTGADGADQFFGMNTLPGDHGSKQGWTDVGAGSSEPAEIHSVGWTDRYFVAILQTAAGPDFDAMRATATAAAQAVYGAQQPAAVSTDTPTAESGPAQNAGRFCRGVTPHRRSPGRTAGAGRAVRPPDHRAPSRCRRPAGRCRRVAPEVVTVRTAPPLSARP